MTTIATLYIVGLVVALLFIASLMQGNSQAACQEDMDCWNCAEMGNKICGLE